MKKLLHLNKNKNSSIVFKVLKHENTLWKNLHFIKNKYLDFFLDFSILFTKSFNIS